MELYNILKQYIFKSWEGKKWNENRGYKQKISDKVGRPKPNLIDITLNNSGKKYFSEKAETIT